MGNRVPKQPGKEVGLFLCRDQLHDEEQDNPTPLLQPRQNLF